MTRITNRWTGATGSDFRIKRNPAKLLCSAVARSTPTLGCFMKRHTTVFLLVFALSAMQSMSLSRPQSHDSLRRYRVGGVGSLELTVPSDWQEVSKTLEQPAAVTLAYRLPSAKEFYMKVTTAWEPQTERSSRKVGWLRGVVEKSGHALLSGSVTEFTLTEIHGPTANGYYFQIPHKDELPIGKFTYVTEGAVDLGKVTLVFTTFSTSKDLAAVADSLRVIESARFVQAN